MSGKREGLFGRRAFLGGAGAMIALPLLPSAARWLSSTGRVRAQAATCETPRRFVAWYVPNGMHMPSYRPSTEGAGFALPMILEPLSEVRAHVNVVSGLWNEGATAQGDGPGDHARGTGSFLTARHVRKTEGSDIRNGISVDQLAAMNIGSCTRFASLELGIDGGDSAGNCDSGYSCAYARNISWAGESTPVPKITSPRVVFDRMFEGFDPSATLAEVERRRRLKTSVLDYALSEANLLGTRLGATDRRKLDEYLTGVREVEMRASAMELASSCTVPARPGEDFDVTEKIDVMSDLQVLALQCDLTRVISFMTANAGSNRTYDFLGIGEGHHSISHHQSSESNYRMLEQIDRWEVERLAYFLGKLAAIEEPDGSSLLDSCAVLFSSEISDGDRHNHDDLPVVIAGRFGGEWETGRHIRVPDRTPIANLFLRILAGLGVPADGFGDDGTEPLSAI
ncbi:MAG: DUF1552 domain-containing protein [Deltaproteobacteria bacterium]|nr:DUF1552 domain-containing protein [Deltaproteobacteria bacterium]